MVRLSRTINPECEHLVGDMHSLRLGRLFDALLVLDTVAYMTTETDLRRAIYTAFVHCRPGGAALFAPDHLRETSASRPATAGNDADGRGLQYLKWTWDPDPRDLMYIVDYV